MMNLKIVVTGTSNSGKTSFCYSISPNWYTESHFLRFINFEIDEKHLLELFEPPSTHGFDFTRETVAEGMIGIVIVMDSSNPQTFRESKIFFETFRANSPIPFVIAANKQDLEGAWPAEDLRIVLRIPPEIPIIPCVASDKKSVANVLIALCEQVLRDKEKEAEG
jgi:uncharacterized protein